MKKSELLKLVEKFDDEDNINEVLLGTDVEKQIKASALTLENFKTLADSNADFIAYLDSLKDTHVNTVIKTMKEKGTWEKQFKDVIEEKYPDLYKVEDPVIAALQEKVAQMEREKQEADKKVARQEKINEAIKRRKENQKNADILELLTADSLEDRLSDENLTKFDTLIENIIKKDRETYIRQGNYPPGAGKGEGTGGSGEKPLTLQEAMKIANENPDVNIDSLMSRVQTSTNKE